LLGKLGNTIFNRARLAQDEKPVLRRGEARGAAWEYLF
jgi:hypothetical protein